MFSSSFRKKRPIPDRSNCDQYFYITNFEQVMEKECSEYDKMNDIIDNIMLHQYSTDDINYIHKHLMDELYNIFLGDRFLL